MSSSYIQALNESRLELESTLDTVKKLRAAIDALESLTGNRKSSKPKAGRVGPKIPDRILTAMCENPGRAWGVTDLEDHFAGETDSSAVTRPALKTTLQRLEEHKKVTRGLDGRYTVAVHNA